MSVDVLKARAAIGASGAAPVARWLAYLTLLRVEGLVLGVRFDTGTIQGLRGAWWMNPIRRISDVSPVAVGTAALLLGGSRLREALAPITSTLPRPCTMWPFLVAHVATLAWVTAEVLKREHLTPSIAPCLWITAWIAAGLLTLGFCLLLVLLPRQLYRRLFSTPSQQGCLSRPVPWARFPSCSWVGLIKSRKEALRATVRQILAEPDYRRELGRATRTRVREQYGMQRLAPQYAELYAQTLRGWRVLAGVSR